MIVPSLLRWVRTLKFRIVAMAVLTGVLFDNVVAALADGKMMVRLDQGEPTTELPNIADREYFPRALQTDQPVVSQPLVGRISKIPIVIIAAPVLSADGKVAGIIGGTLALGSSNLVSDLGGADQRDGSRTLVMNRAGVLLAAGPKDAAKSVRARSPSSEWSSSASASREKRRRCCSNLKPCLTMPRSALP